MVELNDLRSRAASVAAVADLRDIRLFHVESSLDQLSLGGSLGYSFDAEMEVQYVPGTPALIVDGTYEVVLTSAGDEEADDEPNNGEQLASISFQMAALYSINPPDDEPPEFPDDELDAFGKTTGMLALHPYAREFIADLTSRMGLPTLHIATARIPLDKRNDK